MTGPETPYPLGRRVNHDPASRAFAFQAPAKVELKAVDWTRRVGIFDQGNLGSCTGNTAGGWLATDSVQRQGYTVVDIGVNSGLAVAVAALPVVQTGVPVDEDLAVRIYGRATEIDPFFGTYPPDDTGSDGLSVAKVLYQWGLIERYEHCFSLDAFLAALQVGPVLVGSSWHEDMFWPDADGFVHPTGPEVGGHEYLAVAYDPVSQVITFANSWSEVWGFNGHFKMHVEEFRGLLQNEGDATVLYAKVVAPEDPSDPGESPPFGLRQLLTWLVALIKRLLGLD